MSERKELPLPKLGSGNADNQRSQSERPSKKPGQKLSRRVKTETNLGQNDEFGSLKALRKKNKNKDAKSASGLFKDIGNAADDLGREKPVKSPATYAANSPKVKSKDKSLGVSPLSRVKSLKAAEAGTSFSGSRPRALSDAVRKSLANLSEEVSIIKKSMSVADENNEKVIHAEAGNYISAELVEGTLSVPVELLKDKFIFGGHAYDDFDVFSKDQKYFVDFYKDAFRELELSKLYNSDDKLLEDFINLLARNYSDEKEVPFHNFRHGFSVGQVAVSFIVRNYFLKQFFDKMTLFCFVVACIVHDVDHPGNDNKFEQDSRSAKLKKHGTIATLENHHSEKFLELMRTDWNKNIFKYLGPGAQVKVFELICELIMATDMGQHKDSLAFLKNLNKLEDLSNMDSSQQVDFLGCIVHACDLSGQCFGVESAERWEDGINQEMYNQFQRIIKEKLDMPDLFQRFYETGDKALLMRYKSQVGFINFVLVPYWQEVVRLIPEMQDFLANLRDSATMFAEKAEEIANKDI